MTSRAGDAERQPWRARLDGGEASLLDAVELIAERDPDLARIVARHGPPPAWRREPGFATLVQIVLEQQVSLASARAAYRRLAGVVGLIEPARVAVIDAAQAGAAGLTRQKHRYLVAMAQSVLGGRLDLASVATQSDDDARSTLMAVPGVGRWSADVYLLLALRRADIWPAGDLALATSVQYVKRLPRRPGPDEMARLAEGWRPCRSVAARLLWHSYLSGDRARQPGGAGS